MAKKSKKSNKTKLTEDKCSHWLSLKQASEYLSISKETMYRLVSAKAIPSYRIGKLHRFNHKHLDKWITSGESDGSNE